MASLNLQRSVVLARADYELAQGEERCKLHERYLAEKNNLEDQMPFKGVTQKILELEESFENIVFWLQGQLGRKQGVSYSLDQVRALSLFDFYKLKNRFIINQSANGNSE